MDDELDVAALAMGAFFGVGPPLKADQLVSKRMRIASNTSTEN